MFNLLLLYKSLQFHRWGAHTDKTLPKWVQAQPFNLQLNYQLARVESVKGNILNFVFACQFQNTRFYIGVISYVALGGCYQSICNPLPNRLPCRVVSLLNCFLRQKVPSFHSAAIWPVKAKRAEIPRNRQIEAAVTFADGFALFAAFFPVSVRNPSQCRVCPNIE